MKNGSNKKVLITACILMTIVFTAFWPWNMPSLINADKPFVDLSGSIGESVGNANAAYRKATELNSPTDVPGITVTPVPTESPTDIVVRPDETEIRIVIGSENMAGSGELILINNVDVGGEENLEKLVNGEEYAGKTFVLVDNYAETKTYRAARSVIMDSGRDFREEQTDKEQPAFGTVVKD